MSSLSSLPVKEEEVLDSFFLLDTESTNVQQDTVVECLPFLVDLSTLKQNQKEHLQQMGLLEDDKICLLQNKHTAYLKRPLVSTLNSSFVSLDSSRPWILYWTLHGLDLLNHAELLEEAVLLGIVSTLKRCWQQSMTMGDDEDDNPIQQAGGFGGGPGQMAHCAPTYAAVMCLCIIATTNTQQAKTEALDYLQEIRKPLYHWFLSLKQSHGGFTMHHDGEVDVRATYTIAACASLLNIPNIMDSSSVQFVCQCQTYEGGFGGDFMNEAHGGYAYCAVAALELMQSLEKIDLRSLRGWLTRRQETPQGGFNGRSNKLVDGCYSFWQGGAVTIMSRYFSENNKMKTNKDALKQQQDYNYDVNQDYWLSPESSRDSVGLLDQGMLQRYILTCAQDTNGGLRDKPSKPRDFYHSCYNLSGLSACQLFGIEYGHPTKSRVAQTHVLFNIRTDRVKQIIQCFHDQKQES